MPRCPDSKMKLVNSVIYVPLCSLHFKIPLPAPVPLPSIPSHRILFCSPVCALDSGGVRSFDSVDESLATQSKYSTFVQSAFCTALSVYKFAPIMIE
jgi:hypothetical protein